MVQNRNKLIILLVGNISNSIIHTILEQSANKPELTDKYKKESISSFEIAKRYREKMNPFAEPFSLTDIEYIKSKIIGKVTAELKLRISKGYENINLSLVEKEVDKALKVLKISG